MQEDTVGRVLEYFLNPEHAWMFASDVQRAMAEFFGHAGQIPEEAAGYFTEWFLFDFVFRDGKTPLQYFVNTNPLALSEAALGPYRSMAVQNCFDFFEILMISPEKGMDLMSIRDEKKFEVREKMATREGRVGDVLLCRIAKVDAHWEIMGGAALALSQPSVSDKRRMKKEFPDINPRVAWHEIVFPEQQQEMNMQADDLGDGTTLVSGYMDGEEDFDDCAVCQLMKKAKEEGRKPKQEEIELAMKEVNRQRKDI